MADAANDHPARLLASAARGDGEAAAQLLPLVYEELRKLAQHKIAHEPPGSTLQPTALVHEAYLRLFEDKPAGWSGRGHFFAAAAQAMRRILVERARARNAQKRGGGRRKLSLDGAEPFIEAGPEEVLALDEALKNLEAQDHRMSQIVQLRCFAALSADEIALALAISPSTVNREWKTAKAWLRAEMERGDDAAS